MKQFKDYQDEVKEKKMSGFVNENALVLMVEDLRQEIERLKAVNKLK